MSWEAYADNVRAQSQAGEELRVEIFSKEGAACTTERTLLGYVGTLKKAFAGMNEELAELQRDGITRNGERFLYLRFADEEFIFGNTNNKIIIHDSKNMILCGIFPKTLASGNVSKGMTVVAEYLESLNM